MPDEQKIIPVAYTRISIDTESGGVFTACEFPTVSLSHESIDVFTSEGKGEKIHTNSNLTYSDVTLTRGVTDNKSLYEWLVNLSENGMDGNVKDVTIDACDNAGNPIMTWSLTDAYVKNYNPGGMQAGASSVLAESVVLGYKEAKREA